MAAKGARESITLACSDCKRRNYTTEKNKKSIKGPNGEAIISYKSPTPPSGYKYYNTEKNEE